MKHKPSQQGFTLIEIMVVMTIVGMIVSVVLPLVEGIQNNLRAKEEKASVFAYTEALKTYYLAKLDERVSVAASIAQGNPGAATTLLLPDISTATDPINAGVVAAQAMIDAGTVGMTTTSATILARATSNGSRQIAVYIQQPDMTGADPSYVNYIGNQGVSGITPAPSWGAAYCPHKATSFYALNYATGLVSKQAFAMALVISAGANGVYDTFANGGAAPAIPDPAANWTAQGFSIKGDDVGYIINFSALHTLDKRADTTKLRLNRLANAAGAYFRYQYTYDAFVAGTPIDQIINPAGGGNIASYFSLISTASGLRTTLKLPGREMIDEFGNPFQVTQLTNTHPYTLAIYSLCGDWVAIPASAP